MSSIFSFVYLLIGCIITVLFTIRYCKNQTKEEKIEENPSLIVAWVIIILLWPIAIGCFVYGSIKNKHHGEDKLSKM